MAIFFVKNIFATKDTPEQSKVPRFFIKENRLIADFTERRR